MKIETDNSAFEDKKAEVIRILKDTITQLEHGNENGDLRDINGNLVGYFTLFTSRERNKTA